MRTPTLATTLLLLGTGLSFAGAGAPVPEGSQTPRLRAVRVRLWMTPTVRAFGKWPPQMATLLPRTKPFPTW